LLDLFFFGIHVTEIYAEGINILRFLVTGATGLIGYSLAFRLAEKCGLENVQLILPPTERRKEDNYRRKQIIQYGFDIILHDILVGVLDISSIKPFDVLFHLAAFTESEINSPLVHVNDIGTDKLLSALETLLPGKRVVYTSSMACLDRSYPDNTPQAEDYPCKPRIIYGQTKLNGEHFVLRHAEQTGFVWTILRLPTVYGPGYRSGGMFNKLAEGLRSGSLSARLSWPGRMSLIYVDDAADILIELGTKEAGKNSLYHASSGEDPRFNELIDLIANEIGFKRKRIALPSLFWTLLRRLVWLPGLMLILPFKLKIAVWRISLIVIDGMVANTSKLNRELPFHYTLLDAGLAATYDESYDFSISKAVAKKTCEGVS
jgi:UDP-glucose 4-epimerase